MNPILMPVAYVITGFTIATDIGLAAYFLGWLIGLGVKPVRDLRNFVMNAVLPYARILTFIIALSAMGGSLFYENVGHFAPCLLCWWQRIFMYPQTLLIALGIVKNDKEVADYSMGLSAAGFIVALYHFYIQRGGANFLPCGVSGVSCTQHFPVEIGYVTFPVMGLSAFAAMFLLMRLSKRAKVNK